MSFLFSSPSAPAVQPLPVAPADNSAAREAATRDTVVRQRAAGRSSTMVGGMQIAAEEQGQRGLLASRRRGAARTLVG